MAATSATCSRCCQANIHGGDRESRRKERIPVNCEGGYAGMSPASLMTYIRGHNFPVTIG